MSANSPASSVLAATPPPDACKQGYDAKLFLNMIFIAIGNSGQPMNPEKPRRAAAVASVATAAAALAPRRKSGSRMLLKPAVRWSWRHLAARGCAAIFFFYG
jgi:hypothetical protein